VPGGDRLVDDHVAPVRLERVGGGDQPAVRDALRVEPQRIDALGERLDLQERHVGDRPRLEGPRDRPHHRQTEAADERRQRAMARRPAEGDARRGADGDHQHGLQHLGKRVEGVVRAARAVAHPQASFEAKPSEGDDRAGRSDGDRRPRAEQAGCGTPIVLHHRSARDRDLVTRVVAAPGGDAGDEGGDQQRRADERHRLVRAARVVDVAEAPGEQGAAGEPDPQPRPAGGAAGLDAGDGAGRAVRRAGRDERGGGRAHAATLALVSRR
jgi:hypothetical protein